MLYLLIYSPNSSSLQHILIVIVTQSQYIRISLNTFVSNSSVFSVTGVWLESERRNWRVIDAMMLDKIQTNCITASADKEMVRFMHRFLSVLDCMFVKLSLVLYSFTVFYSDFSTWTSTRNNILRFFSRFDWFTYSCLLKFYVAKWPLLNFNEESNFLAFYYITVGSTCLIVLLFTV